ncbi:MAG: thioredoxin family protein [Sulfuriferula sp.]|nr:thioredoxin family protein [Sulfuriferula sp.]
MHLTALNEFDFHPSLSHSAGVSLVLFTAPHCGSCKAWLRLLQTLDTPLIQHTYSVDVQIATALAREYDVFHLPSLFLFVHGQFHAPLQAEANLNALIQAITHALNAQPHEEP